MKLSFTELTNGGKSNDEMAGAILYNGKSLAFTVYLDGCEEVSVGKFCEFINENINVAIEKAYDSLIRDMLELYNENWRDTYVSDGKGGYVVDCQEELTPEQFKGKFVVDSINVTGDGMFEVSFGDSELFGNHYIFTTFYDGTKMEDYECQMYG